MTLIAFDNLDKNYVELYKKLISYQIRIPKFRLNAGTGPVFQFGGKGVRWGINKDRAKLGKNTCVLGVQFVKKNSKF